MRFKPRGWKRNSIILGYLKISKSPSIEELNLSLNMIFLSLSILINCGNLPVCPTLFSLEIKVPIIPSISFAISKPFFIDFSMSGSLTELQILVAAASAKAEFLAKTVTASACPKLIA